jgi:hypothetical protein
MIHRMLAMVEGYPRRILEPHGGKGDLVEGIIEHYGTGMYSRRDHDISVIEKDPLLQTILLGKKFKLIDQDFLSYSAPDQFDLIIANPPFDHGEKHLLKAINIMYRGQIVFLLNADTIRKPNTLLKKTLTSKLDELGATVKIYKNAFVDAERQTNVDVALVYIKIERQIEDELFAGMTDAAEAEKVEVTQKQELSTGKNIEELVAEYNEIIRLATTTIMDYYRNSRKLGNYLSLHCSNEDETIKVNDLTATVQNKINSVVITARKRFWAKVLNLDAVKKRLTEKKRQEFHAQIDVRSQMDFNEANIRQFVLNLIGSYEQTLTEAVIDCFDMMSRRFAWDTSIHCKNTHYFDGWKTNDAFKVGKKVIIPMHAGYGHAFVDTYNGGWKLDWSVKGKLNDIDLVMNYFDGAKDYISIEQALEEAFARNTNKCESTYFNIIAYKKGTLHLTFKSEDILRRFNVVACRGKGWLPEDYGTKPFAKLSAPEQALAKEFEGQQSYSKNAGKQLFATSSRLQISEAA